MDQRLNTPHTQRPDKSHLVAMSVTAVIVSAILAYVFFRLDFIPNPSSAERDQIDALLRLLFSIGSVFFAIIITVFVYVLLFFRRRPGDTSDSIPIRGWQPLELAWTFLPMALVLGLGAYGGIILNQMTAPGTPQTELKVNVLAFRFGWQFTYPDYDNVSSFELEIPVNRRVHFLIQSKDVVHSFWVQELGPKQDAVPGMTTELYLTPTKIGQYLVQCSQLCGYGHTYMTAPVHVTSEADFQTWVKQQQKTTTPAPTPSPAPAPAPSPAPTPTTTFQTLAAAGQTVYSQNCAVCHGANGQGGAGPPLWGTGFVAGKYNGVTLFNNNAQDMLNFISTRMPLSAPGSLSHEQYVDVLCYLLIQENEVSPSSAFNESQLGSIILK